MRSSRLRRTSVGRSSIHEPEVKPVPKTIDIFQGLTRPQLDELRGWLQRRDFAAHELIMTEGDVPEGMFILYSGRVAVVKSSSAGHFRLANAEAPTVIGEMSLLLDREARSASVRAETPVIAGLLHADIFEHKLQAHNVTALLVALNIGRLLADRLRETDKQLAKAAGRLTRRARTR